MESPVWNEKGKNLKTSSLARSYPKGRQLADWLLFSKERGEGLLVGLRACGK